MKVYSTYFGSRRGNGMKSVSIARYSPKWFTGGSIPSLMPSSALLKESKERVMDLNGEYKEKYFAGLKKAKEVFRGIHYNLQDMRAVLEEEYDSKVMVITNPPAYARGYERMFPMPEGMSFDPMVPEWDLKKEFQNIYRFTANKPATYVWYKYKELDFIDKDDCLFAKEYTKDRFDYWVSPSAVRLENIRLKAKMYKPSIKFSTKIVPKDYHITENSRITVKKVSEEHAIYLRDLWAHKMGSTAAEDYILLAIDGYAWGVVGMHCSECRKMQTDEVFEVFGFNATLDNHMDSNRLRMLAITTREFINRYMSFAKTNRFFEINHFKTTCISKYRKVKTNNGIMEIRDREKMKNGQYKIVYITPVYERTIKEAIKIYLTEKRGNDNE